MQDHRLRSYPSCKFNRTPDAIARLNVDLWDRLDKQAPEREKESGISGSYATTREYQARLHVLLTFALAQLERRAGCRRGHCFLVRVQKSLPSRHFAGRMLRTHHSGEGEACNYFAARTAARLEQDNAINPSASAQLGAQGLSAGENVPSDVSGHSSYGDGEASVCYCLCRFGLCRDHSDWDDYCLTNQCRDFDSAVCNAELPRPGPSPGIKLECSPCRSDKSWKFNVSSPGILGCSPGDIDYNWEFDFSDTFSFLDAHQFEFPKYVPLEESMQEVQPQQYLCSPSFADQSRQQFLQQHSIHPQHSIQPHQQQHSILQHHFQLPPHQLQQQQPSSLPSSFRHESHQNQMFHVSGIQHQPGLGVGPNSPGLQNHSSFVAASGPPSRWIDMPPQSDIAPQHRGLPGNHPDGLSPMSATNGPASDTSHSPMTMQGNYIMQVKLPDSQPAPFSEPSLGHHGIASGGASPNHTAAPTVKELRAFAQDFKVKRIKLGFTQKEVGEQLEDYGGQQLSQTTICRFEAQQLSENNRVKIYHILRRWCDGVGSSNKQPLPPNNKIPSKRRKKRTSIDAHVRAQLDERFSHHPKPSALDIGQLAAQVGLGKEVVRVWFCNRRQKERRGAGLADNQQ